MLEQPDPSPHHVRAFPGLLVHSSTSSIPRQPAAPGFPPQPQRQSSSCLSQGQGGCSVPGQVGTACPGEFPKGSFSFDPGQGKMML